MFTHLHARSWFSFRAGGSSPEALVETAAHLGYDALALTDRHGVYGAVRFQRACNEHGLKPIIGAEVPVDGHELVLLAKSRDGYSNLCQLLTAAHLRSRENPSATFEELAARSEELFCLTGVQEGRLWRLVDSREYTKAYHWISDLRGIFDDRLFIEVTHQRRPGDSFRVRRLTELSSRTNIPLVATGDVRFAVAHDYRRYDLLTCIRLGNTVFDITCEERPYNDEAHLKNAEDLKALGIPDQAFWYAGQIADACEVNLLPGHIIPPGAKLPPGVSARELLRRKCKEAFDRLYPPGDRRRTQAAERLRKEITIIEQLDVGEFFLVVNEVVGFARRSGIRCSGRGSAANSIVTYLLGITPICPIEHNLLFERFLHRGRTGTPDIDLDFDSSRRLEVIQWMESRFGIEHTGMSATIDRYLTKSAIQDTAKALGWPADVASKMSKGCSYQPPHDPENLAHLRHIGGDTPLLDRLVEAATTLMLCPRHLGQHSGGMVLARTPMHCFTPLQESANGVLIVQFDKEDLEWLGLVKLDVLGLRMMGAIAESVSIIAKHTDSWLDLDNVPLDDPAVYDMICEGDVLGLFQIESPAQQSAGARMQSRSMQDLIKQVSVVRPGPILGNGFHHFIQRHQGIEPVRYEHPILEDILSDTYGVIIFQEQVLEVCHSFAGLSLEEADIFRRLMSKFRDPGEMEGMRDKFVDSAVRNGIKRHTADKVFNQVSKFVGYGFCRSHAAAFALTVYYSAYLKLYYPAAFYAGVFQHAPGMYSRMTLEQDARRHRIFVLVPDINRSVDRYDIEKYRGGLAIRKPLSSVKGISAALAKEIVIERQFGAFDGIEDFYHRVSIDSKALISLAKAGAFDSLEGPNRTALYKIRVLERQFGRSGTRPAAGLVNLKTIRPADVPALPGITLKERIQLDLITHRGPRVHPMVVLRSALSAYEIRPIELVRTYITPTPIERHRTPTVTVAGLVMFRQRPQTAKGTMFLFLEDETGFIQCICNPRIREEYYEELKSAALIIRGDLQAMGSWRSIRVTQVYPLQGAIGGYKGRHGGRQFGREERILQYESLGANAHTGHQPG